MPDYTRFEFLKRELSENRLSRRGFLQQASALGLMAAVPAGLIGSQAQAATPNKGGNFRIGVGGGSTTDSLDPATYANAFSQTLGSTIHSSLTEVGTDSTLQSAVAESWEASSDATAWTFKIRSGVTAHNGKTIDANDVIASLNHHRGESTSSAKPFLDPVTNISAPDANTVVIELNGGNADFPFILSDFRLVIMPSDGGSVEVAARDGIGVGPYKLESFDPGVRARTSRNDNFYGDGQNFDSVEFITIADSTARTNALVSGDVDYIDRVDLNTVHLLKRQSGITVQEVKGMQHYTLPMNITTNPFTDNNIRLALKHGIDREAVVKTVLRGYGSVGNDHPISSANRFFNSELAQRTYDPDKAKHYLKQADLDSLTVGIHPSDAAFAGAVDTAVLYKEHAAPAGITLDVVREPADGYWSNVWMKKPWSFSYWNGSPIEDRTLTTAYEGGAAWNESFMDFPDFNELLVAARSELDTAKRKDMYWQLQAILNERGGSVIPMFASYVSAHSNKVAHADQVAKHADMDGYKIANRWWFT
ncbi:Periplasmic dipeptide transport protein precursor [Falsiruegeria litorea R37]|uniref:Periplasmic dipeptide transport protein n=1 Tax=Falsiruegeria litorea R37 TaxID=1200284 RepID=A0A1Y5RX44_9RHOB|nr:ABC transporter substrate-binding protein [Falsiruegeria litorea]SLN26181.1 Periplasmic dipeptide transport protein precursor [Falsiruegeria litorea R37]